MRSVAIGLMVMAVASAKKPDMNKKVRALNSVVSFGLGADRCQRNTIGVRGQCTTHSCALSQAHESVQKLLHAQQAELAGGLFTFGTLDNEIEVGHLVTITRLEASVDAPGLLELCSPVLIWLFRDGKKLPKRVKRRTNALKI